MEISKQASANSIKKFSQESNDKHTELEALERQADEIVVCHLIQQTSISILGEGVRGVREMVQGGG